MPRGQVSQDVVRANVAAILHGQELVGFDPKNSHAISLCRSAYVDQRAQTAFLPTTKVMKATMAAEYKDEKVRAASAIRESGRFDAGKRGQTERVKRHLHPKRRTIERLRQEYRGDQKRQQGKGHGQSRKFVTYEFE